jgi:N-acetylmuramoyl-L-alanine amidase
VAGTAAAVWMSGPIARAGEHVVAPGETLSAIAHRYGVSVEHLARLNELANPNLIIAGQRLRVPARAVVESVHVVSRGETLSSIAARYGTSVGVLARANRIEDVNLIVVGAHLRIPRGSVPSSAPQQSTGGSGGIERALEVEARAAGIEPSLVKAVAWHESRWEQDAVSSAGAVGVMQVMPETAGYVNESLGGGDLDVEKARDNVELGVRYLDHLMEAMPSRKKALAAYNSGPGAVGEELEGYQRDYVDSVTELRPKF